MQKKLEASATVFKQTLKLRPDDLEIRRYLAANLWQLHRFSEAKANLEVLLRQKPDDRQGRLLMGMVAENTRDYATAAKMLSSVPEEVRQRPESMAALARAYYHLGDEEKTRGMLAKLSGRAWMITADPSASNRSFTVNRSVSKRRVPEPSACTYSDVISPP